MEISLLGAFVGGVLTLLSPCSVMLLPAFFSYAFTSPTQLLTRTGVFYLGLITTLVPLGVLAGTVGAFVNQHRLTFVTVAAVIVILLGVAMVVNIPIPFLRGGRSVRDTSPASVYALGTVYGLAGVCAGPLLGAVLTVAALGGNSVYGGITLLVFAGGMVSPLVILALLWGRLPFVRSLVRPREIRLGRWRNTWTGVIGGMLTSMLGLVLILTEGTSSLSGLLGTTQQMQLEGWIYDLTQGVPDLVVVLFVLLIAGGAWGATWWNLVHRHERQRAAVEDEEPTETSKGPSSRGSR